MLLGGLTLSVCAQAETKSYFKILEMPGFSSGISDNGKWVISTVSQTEAFLYNDDTGAIISLLTGNIASCEAYDVTDSGMVVGNADNQPAYYMDGKWHMLDIPAGFAEGTCKLVAAEGSMILGELSNGLYFTPVVWKNNVPELMEVLPKDPFGKAPAAGFKIAAVSGDGSRVGGKVISSEYSWYPVLWDNETPDYIGTDLFVTDKGKPNQFELREMNISDNGRFMVLDVIDATSRYPYLWDIDNDILTLLDGELICVVDNDGRVFSCSPQDDFARTTFVHEEGETYVFENWVKDNFGLDIFANKNVETSGTPMGISADGNTITGFCTGHKYLYNYILHLDPSDANKLVDNTAPKPTVVTRKSDIIVHSESGASVSVTDISGRKVFEGVMKENTCQIPLNPGSYIVSVIRKGSVFTNKTLVSY